MDLVSYIVPAYNVAPYIVRCVESILSQTHRNIEVILVDDGTMDNLHETIASFTGRIKLISTPNRGVSAARNLGFEHSTGDYIVFLDGDDFVEPRHAELLLQSAQSDPTFTGAFCNMTYIEEASGELRKLHKSDHSNRVGRVRQSALMSNIQLGCLILSRENVALAGGFDPCFQCGEDWDFVLKASRFGNWSFVPDALTNYLVRASSVSANYRKIYEQGRIVIEKHIETDSTGQFKALRRQWHHGFSMYVGHIVRQSIKIANPSRLRAVLQALTFCVNHPRFFYYTLKRYASK